MSEPVDTAFYTVQLAVLSAASIALSGTSKGTPERTYLAPSDPDWDECCGTDGRGRLVAWPEDIFPVELFPQPFAGALKCQHRWAVVVAVQVLRCDDDPVNRAGATDDDLTQRQDRWLMEDATALADAVCALTRARLHVAVRGLGVVGPEGGCVGTEMRIVVAT